MKYPQLVSTRAVNAISDWLVSQLEQLGVEAPLIYSRLLLSLLHTSVQINDPTEFSNLEAYLSTRKGNKRNPPCDTDTLKKLTAVQCLMETVSSEQEITKIENLIEELCEKLNDIENNQEEKNELENNTARPQSSSKLKTNETEDPRKRYYRAFPALSKEMEDSVWITNKNVKALTWPSGNNTIVTTNSTPNVVTSINNTAGVKRKSKRQRNQAMSKGKMRYIRKNSYSGSGGGSNNNSSPIWDIDFEGSWEMGHDLIKEFITKQNNRNRSTSESEACNIRRRCRRTEEKEEMNNFNEKSIMSFGGDNDENDDFYDLPNNMKTSSDNSNENKTGKLDGISVKMETQLNDDDLSTSSDMLQQNEISISHNAFIINDEGDLTNNAITTQSLSGIDGTLNSARRLYQRDISNDSVNLCSSSKQQNDFAQFKAKFNSRVEALWKNTNNDLNNQQDESLTVGGGSDGALPSLPSSLSSTKYENLKNFWTKYYNHHYDTEKLNDFHKPTDNDPVVTIDKIDFFSMPADLNSTRTNKVSVNPSKKSIRDNFTPTCGVFLQNSIWSDNSSNKNSKEYTFYENVMGLSHKNDEKIDNNFTTTSSLGGPYSFNISKWSECSFETPFVPSSVTSLSIDASLNKNDLRENMLKNSYLYNYKQSNAQTSSNNNTGKCNSSIYHHNQQHQQSNPTLSMTTTDIFGIINAVTKSTTASTTTTTATATATATTTAAAATNSFTSQNKITLINHSLNSGFVEYSRIKSSSKNNGSNYEISKADNNKNTPCTMHSLIPPSASISPPAVSGDGCHSTTGNSGDDENLLTSNRTHFRPIKQSYADGYEFDISNNVDEIKFERSKSGYLYFESEKYLEYIRYDTFISDDEPVVFSSSSSAVTAANDSKSDGSGGKKMNKNKRKKDELILKFRIKQTEKYCQTESEKVECEEDDNAIVTHLNNTCNDNSSNNECKSINNNLTVPTVAENYNSDSESILSIENTNCMSTSNNSNSSSCCNNNNYYYYHLKDDEKSVNLEQWSMAEIGKRCQNNNNITHTLWGMCPACNNDSMKSVVPANRLLKAELNLEADEIMSDLKYMQDLYIGSSCGGGDDDDDDGGNSDWEEDDIDLDDDDTDYDAEMLKECELYETMVLDTLTEDDDCGSGSGIQKQKQQQKEDDGDDHVYYDVTKFISDLLKPENAKSLANALGATSRKICNKKTNDDDNAEDDDYCKCDDDGDDDIKMNINENDNNNSINTKNNNNIAIEKYIGGLWSNNDENIIWNQQQQQQQQEISKILNNDDDYNVESFTNFQKNSSSLLEKFGNWKYSNLAKLWKNNATVNETNCSHHQHHQQQYDNNKSNDKNIENIEKNTEKHIEKTHSSCTNKSDNKIFKNFISFNNISTHHQKSNGNDKILNKQQSLPITAEIINITPIVPTTTAATNRLNDDDNNKNVDNNIIQQKVTNRFDRKRRHSASNSVNLTEIINDDGDDDNNTSNQRSASDLCDSMIIKNKIGVLMKKTEFKDNYDKKTTKLLNEDDNDESPATIITCKYWATTANIDIIDKAKKFFSTKANLIDGIDGGDEIGNTDGSHFIDGISTTALALNPSSILKQVAVVTRPLTR